MSKKTSNSLKKSPASTNGPEWVTVAQNLIRHRDSKIYYLRSKCKGKQLKRSLGTTDRQLANRKLKIALADLAKKNPAILVVPASTTVQTLISHFFPTRIVGAKPKTAARIKNAYDAISAPVPLKLWSIYFKPRPLIASSIVSECFDTFLI